MIANKRSILSDVRALMASGGIASANNDNRPQIINQQPMLQQSNSFQQAATQQPVVATNEPLRNLPTMLHTSVTIPLPSSIIPDIVRPAQPPMNYDPAFVQYQQYLASMRNAPPGFQNTISNVQMYPGNQLTQQYPQPNPNFNSSTTPQMPYDPFRSQRSRATDIYDASVVGSQYTSFPQQNPVMPIMPTPQISHQASGVTQSLFSNFTPSNRVALPVVSQLTQIMSPTEQQKISTLKPNNVFQHPISNAAMLQQLNTSMLQHPMPNASMLPQQQSMLPQQQPMSQLSMLQQHGALQLQPHGNLAMLQQPNASMLQQQGNLAMLHIPNALQLQQQNAAVFDGSGSGSGIKIMARPQNASTVQYITQQSQQRPPQTTYTKSTSVTYKSSENSACGRKRARREAIHIFERILQLTIQKLEPVDTSMHTIESLRQTLQGKLSVLFPGAHLVLYGSAVTGLSLCHSDLDMCLKLPFEVYTPPVAPYVPYKKKQIKSENEDDNVDGGSVELEEPIEEHPVQAEKEIEKPVEIILSWDEKMEIGKITAGDVVERMAESFHTDEQFFEEILALPKARVPIIKFYVPIAEMFCDICINNDLAPINSQLLASYVAVDSRVRPFVFAIKYLAKQRDMNDPYTCTLSSYAFVLLAIHYLQVCSPPVLPCLQRYTVDGKTPSKIMVGDADVYFYKEVSTLKEFGAANRSSVAELLAGFFHYFAYDFNYRDDVVSVRVGGCLSKEDKEWTQAKKTSRGSILLCIEDPFELSHNLGRMVHRETLHRIRGEWMRAHRLLVEGNAIETLFDKVPVRVTPPVASVVVNSATKPDCNDVGICEQ